LSNDGNLISALPPEQYGDRFYHFIEGITMSHEVAIREAQMKEQAAAQSVAEKERVSSWNSSLRRRSAANVIPPIPNYLPPPPPTLKSPEAGATAEKASQEAYRTDKECTREEDIPERTIASIRLASDRRESIMQPGPHESILPVVEEAAEGASTGGRSGRSQEDEMDGRPVTPMKMAQGRIAVVNRQGPPTPPKGGYLKPESQDSGYGCLGNGSTVSRDNSLIIKSRVSRESLNKDLPPLPKTDNGNDDNGVRMDMA
jgi:1-phosphatidylinositol-4-phosphate 5-kinase